ncbi:MAG: beta-galactosidase [Pirellulaceae bacterium]
MRLRKQAAAACLLVDVCRLQGILENVTIQAGRVFEPTARQRSSRMNLLLGARTWECITMIRVSSCLVLALGFAWSSLANGVETVRVDASSGAPRLVVDGKPVRARMFFGLPGTKPLSADAAGSEISFEFTPTRDEPHAATMHLRFGQRAGTVELDDIRVQDLTTGVDVLASCDFESGNEALTNHWEAWPQGDNNTVGQLQVLPGCGRDGSAGLQVVLRAPAVGGWPDFHLHHRANLTLRKDHRYRVSLWVRANPARELMMAFYRPGNPYVFLGGPSNGYESQIKMAGEAGARFVSFPVYLPWPRPEEQVDWSIVDAQCQQVLAANPQALLLPRISCNAPQWWRAAHPDDDMVWDHGPQFGYPVVASPDYRRDAAERLAALVTHLESKFGGSMAGYHPCGQNTDEWFYQETWGSVLNGYAQGDLQAWRHWLQERYGDDVALRAAWHDPQTSLSTAQIPTPAARRAAPAGVLRDPVTERPVIDFTEFQQQAMADCVCVLARAVRQATQGRKLVVFFYGYLFEFGAVANGPGTAGHYALRRVLDCPDIDVLCSPISYFDRGPGQSAPAMTAAESVALAGKMWLYEDDARTYLSAKDSGYDRVETLAETNAELLRNTGQCAVRNFATWWMDLGAAGWFDDPRMWAEMKRLSALDDPLLAVPRPFRPDVAAVIDEQSMLRVAAGGAVATLPGVYHVRRPLGRMGTPYGQYLQDDVIGGKVKAKMYVFLTAWCLAPEQRARLLEATRGSTRVWCYAPGYHEPAATSLEAMHELTGFRLARVTPGNALATPTAAGKQLGLTGLLGVEAPINPLFAAQDATPEEILATYADGSAAVALRRTADGVSLFVGPPGLTSELLRLAARTSDVPLFTESDCNVYANGPYLVLHAAQDGPLELNTGTTGAIHDLLDGQVVGQGPQITLAIKKGETRILVLQE